MNVPPRPPNLRGGFGRGDGRAPGGPSGRGPGGGSGNPFGGFRLAPSTRRSLVAAAVILALVVLVVSTATFWVNWWWFGDVGYRSLLTTRYLTRLMAFVAGGLVGGGFVFANLVFALRRSRGRRSAGDLPAIGERLFVGLLLGLSTLVFLLTGSGAAGRWQDWLLVLNRQSFGVDDPVFGRDVGFYVFTLPVLRLVLSAATSLVFVTLLGVVAVYVLRLGMNPRNYRRVPDLMRRHVFPLAALLMLLVAASFYLANFGLVYSERGVVFGPSYTDVTIARFFNWALVVLSVAVALVLLVNAARDQFRFLAGAAAAWAVVALLGAIVPAVTQRTLVEPNELRREQEYIANNIAMTRQAHDLAGVEEQPLVGGAPITEQDLASQPTTVDNIRLWDYRVAQEVYQQFGARRPYYVFTDVDVDRYNVDGTYRQVLISARELDTTGLPANAQTWTNRHLAYTHGYGVIVSPVGEVAPEGTPPFIVSDLPPEGTGDLAIERPEIYFGERPAEWVVLGTETTEFTALDEEAPAYAGNARGSIRLDDLFTQLVTATFLRDRNVLLSGELTAESRLLIRRGVVERAEAIAPFLTYDPDPYIVIADGRLVWVLDAYTATDRWPGAERSRGVNYLRNSVKVVVDAYDGTTTFYRTSTPDPIADAWGEVYGDLFTPISEVPPSIAAHFRYPELLFDVQSDILRTHHVTDPRDFYNGNDRWAIPASGSTAGLGGGGGGPESQIEPYYVTMALPGETDPDFTLILPFIPGGNQTRQNMTGWLGARTGAGGEPRLQLYRFGESPPVSGPQQISAQIQQTDQISSRITLLDQSGSEVIRGNLLVIPLNDTVLYAQPLYVRARNSAGAYAQLQFVIAASNGPAVMEPTLDGALASLVARSSGAGSAPAAEPAPPPAQQPPTATPPAAPTAAPGQPGAGAAPSSLAQQALAAYERAQVALASGDFATYGAELATMEALLQQAAGQPSPATPSP
ncbi:MAG: INTEGRAL MEMBRANE PROTEIN (Rhomboid family) [uncultured Thermomicrobiales bacterium]|uniref:UPF0182 protein AVDCRST_MAG49-1455 n=1 Tax=uncultured Thermomicrobiales bacterium TaxID=1645740 RepID=A0A6J4UDE7_9BACT|nr:MAG: INTEGRAL MEMBRANE PROTEIN (Rhomboid family) [uncultured Thermomicrobiales bacterium]